MREKTKNQKHSTPKNTHPPCKILGPCPSQYLQETGGRKSRKAWALNNHLMSTSSQPPSLKLLAVISSCWNTLSGSVKRLWPSSLMPRDPFIWVWSFKWLNFFFLFLPHCMSCRILVPGPGFEPVPPEVEAQSPNHWTTREIPDGTLRLKNRVLCSAPDKGYQPHFLPWNKPLLHREVLPSLALALSTLQWWALSGVHLQPSSGSVSMLPQFDEYTSVCNNTP